MVALTAIVLALGWPVEGLAQRFQWGHMLQHMLLIAVAAPLLVLSEPWLRPLHAMPRRWRGPTGRVLFRDPRTERLRAAAAWFLVPVIAWAAFHAVFIAFHVPALYELTLHHPFVHDAEHLLFLGLAIGFWVPVIHRERMGTMDRLVYLMAAGFVGSALGLWLVTAPPQYGYPGAGWLSAAGGSTAGGRHHGWAGVGGDRADGGHRDLSMARGGRARADACDRGRQGRMIANDTLVWAGFLTLVIPATIYLVVVILIWRTGSRTK